MQLSINWLKKFVDIPKGFSAADLAHKLTMTTVEVEGWRDAGKDLENVVVGKILKIKNHPNADKLRLTVVDVGGGKLNIVCGGTNLREGMLVAVAKIGAKVKWHGEGEPVEIKETEIRGEKSYGMICAASEIGLENIFPGGDHEIMDLTALNLEIGTPLARAIDLDDVVLEIDNKSLSNRPDLWGHYGLARELAAIFKVPMKKIETKDFASEGKKIKLSVEIKDKDKCRRYMGVALDNVKIAPSPAWLAQQLEAVGVRAINNVVDVTNYVMLELGQPMHAFDAARLKSAGRGGQKSIIVRAANAGEKFVTLDSVERILDEEALMISDGEKNLALAGVMGGLDSQIEDDTTTIIFEAANFDASNIRKTSTKLGLRTESSARFEKALDPLLCATAIRRAVNLIMEIIPGCRVASKLVDENYYKFAAPEIDLPFGFVTKKIGQEIGHEWIVETLTNLEFDVKVKKNGLAVRVPSFRATKDVSIPEDLVEEIARIYGYDNIAPAMPEVRMDPPREEQELRVEWRVKNILARDLGFTEVYNYSFVNEKSIEKFGFKIADHIRVKNALSSDQSLMRVSLVPNLLNNVIDNSRFFSEFKLFELDRVFHKEKGPDARDAAEEEFLPRQDKYLAGVICGPSDCFYGVKGAVETLLKKLKVEYSLNKSDKNLPNYLAGQRSLAILVNKEIVGWLGELNHKIKNNLAIEEPVAIFELNFEKIWPLANDNVKFRPLSKFPEVNRDLAILVGEKTEWQAIEKLVLKLGQPLVKTVDLFDVYEGGKIEAGKKSLAFHIIFSADDRTLEGDEVKKIENKIIIGLEKEFGAKIR